MGFVAQPECAAIFDLDALAQFGHALGDFGDVLGVVLALVGDSGIGGAGPVVVLVDLLPSGGGLLPALAAFGQFGQG